MTLVHDRSLQQTAWPRTGLLHEVRLQLEVPSAMDEYHWRRWVVVERGVRPLAEIPQTSNLLTFKALDMSSLSKGLEGEGFFPSQVILWQKRRSLVPKVVTVVFGRGPQQLEERHGPEVHVFLRKLLSFLYCVDMYHYSTGFNLSIRGFPASCVDKQTLVVENSTLFVR